MQSVDLERQVWPDNTIYFLTDSTFLHYPYFKEDEQKRIILDQIIKINKLLKTPISDYSIAVNHYHLKFYLKYGSDLAKVKQYLRGGVSFEYRKKYDVSHKEMWQSRKILCIYSEEMNWRVSGYIIGNLLKHREVSTFEELKNSEFSSFKYMADKYGEKEMSDLVYSIIDVDEDVWGEVNLKNLMAVKTAKTRLKSR